MGEAVDPEYEHELRILQMRFIGKIIAGFTHEIKNYIAIINESTGLIGDMMKLGKSLVHDLPVYLDIIHSIEDHVDKTNLLFRFLNRFAHRMDTQISSLQINECLEELIALLERFATQKKIKLHQDYESELPTLRTNPSLLQLIIFTYIEKNIIELDQGGSITIQTSASDRGISVKIGHEGKAVSGSSVPLPANLLKGILNELGGSISQDADNETILMLSV